MKNIIDFILESQGQKPRYRSSNKPYDAKNNELTEKRNTRPYRAVTYRLSKFVEEFNEVIEKFPYYAPYFVLALSTTHVPTNFDLNKKDDTNKLVQFKNPNTKGKATYNLLDIDNIKELGESGENFYKWVVDANYNGKPGTIRLNIEDKNNYYLNFSAYHDNIEEPIYLNVFLLQPSKNDDLFEAGWDTSIMIRSAWKRINKSKNSANGVNVIELQKGKYTGKNVAEAFIDIIEGWD